MIILLIIILIILAVIRDYYSLLKLHYDDIILGFAASFSIVTSCILCYFVFDFHPNLLFVSGAILVNASMYMYSFGPEKVKLEDSKVDVKNVSRISSGDGSENIDRSDRV